VHDADVIILRFIERAFTDLGYAGTAAQTRAHLLFSAGVARFTPPWTISHRILDEVLEILAPAASDTMVGGRSSKLT
jgi:hypothetical protein